VVSQILFALAEFEAQHQEVEIGVIKSTHVLVHYLCLLELPALFAAKQKTK